MKMYSIRNDINYQQSKEYLDELDRMTDNELIREFFTYIDYEEESDSGRVFSPVQISSCRVMLGQALGDLLVVMRDRIKTKETI